MCGIATVAFVAIMTLRGEFKRLTGSLIALAAVITIATVLAIGVGGGAMVDRIFTLVEDDAGQVYYSNRGRFLDYTFSVVLPTYPFGAGLGRYGMMNMYFGRDKGALYSEIQWTSWAYDGGWLMVVAYPLALLAALYGTLRIALDRTSGQIGLWAAVLFGYNMAAIAVLFSYSLFLSQSGLEFWLLNAALYSAAQVEKRLGNKIVPAGFENVPAPWRPGENVKPLPKPNVAPLPHPNSRRRELAGRPAPVVVPNLIDADSSEGMQ
jgi:hypothetical protein